MTHDQQTRIDKIVARAVQGIRDTKGKEYATEEDTLADFKEVAVEAGVTPLQCWATYVKKHQRAIDTFIRSEDQEVKSEPIEGRVLDVIVYHHLLLGLLFDLELNDAPDCILGEMIVGPEQPPMGGPQTPIIHREPQDPQAHVPLAHRDPVERP